MIPRHPNPQDTVAALNRRLADLRSINRELVESARCVAQDLQNPLTRILCVAGLLRSQPAITGNPVARDMAEQLLAGAAKMQTLINDYLAFFKAGRHELRVQPISLERLLQLVRHELEPLAAGRNVHWQISPLPEIEGDASMLHQALLNLLSNSLKFTRARPQAVIEIGLQAHPAETILYVRDNGIGFDVQVAANLFHQFQRFHRDQGFEGTGVGLVIVHHIVQRHGGRAWAEGVPGKGATFFIALPSKRQGAQPALP